MTKLPARKKYIIPSELLKQTFHPYLSIKPLKWQRIAPNSFAAVSDGVSYIVSRKPKPNEVYWFASVKADDEDYIILGEEFLSRFEGMEVCEAWEYQRTKELGIKNEEPKQIT